MRHPNVIAAGSIALAVSAVSAQGPGFEGLVAVLERACVDCHGSDTKKGGLDLSGLPASSAEARLVALSKARDRVRAGEMPPADAEPILDVDRSTLLDACDAILAHEAPKLRPGPGRVTVRRLSRNQWDCCIEDLFGVSTQKSSAFPADDLGYGFDSIGDALSFSTLRLEACLAAAEDVAAQVFFDDEAEARSRTIEGEAMELVAGPGFGAHADVASLYTNATIGGDFELSRGGTCRIVAHLGATRAGEDPARVSVRLDGRELALVDVLQRELRPEAITLPVGKGRHRLEIAFVNDHWDPEHPDPAMRDRNVLLDRVVVEGPLEPRSIPMQQGWLEGLDKKPFDVVARTIASRVWRGASKPEAVRELATVAERRVKAGGARSAALADLLAAALASPRFLFRVEAPSTRASKGSVEAVPAEALASRLSFFLWSSCPDVDLLDAARRGELDSASGRRAQVTRMLQDERANRLASDFAAQWLELRSLEARMPDPSLFAGFDDAVRASMRRETELLFLAVLREERDARDLLDADFTHVDATLARLYGIEGDFGPSFTRVRLEGAMATRRGVLGHASWLVVTSNPTRTSPVKRGKWTLDNLFDQAPPPPPPGNAIFADEGAAATPQGLRAQLAAHRARSECANCHVRMDAYGLALEQFDAVGRLRDSVGGQPVDATAQLPSGVVVDGVAGLRAMLREDPGFLRALQRKLFVYAVGRDATPLERLVLDAAVDRIAATGRARIRDLVEVVVESEAFLMREANR